MGNFDKMTNVPFEYLFCDDRLPIGTGFHPASSLIKNDKAEGWVITPPEEYLASEAKYEEFRSILDDITIDFNIGLMPHGRREEASQGVNNATS